MHKFPEGTIYGWRSTVLPMFDIKDGVSYEITVREDGCIYYSHYAWQAEEPYEEKEVMCPEGFLYELDACLREQQEKLDNLPQNICNYSLDGSSDDFRFRDYAFGGLNISTRMLDKESLAIRLWDKIWDKSDDTPEDDEYAQAAQEGMRQTNELCGVLESLGKVFKQHELEYGFAEAETGESSWIFELCCLGAVLLYIPLMALMSIKPLCRLILRGLLGKEAVRD